MQTSSNNERASDASVEVTSSPTNSLSELFDLQFDIDSIPFQASFKVSEVLEICQIKPYVLRFWESEFEEIGPAISDSGQKLYSFWDLHVLLAVKHFLFEKKFPIQKAKVEFRKVYQKAVERMSVSSETATVDIDHVEENSQIVDQVEEVISEDNQVGLSEVHHQDQEGQGPNSEASSNELASSEMGSIELGSTELNSTEPTIEPTIELDPEYRETDLELTKVETGHIEVEGHIEVKASEVQINENESEEEGKSLEVQKEELPESLVAAHASLEELPSTDSRVNSTNICNNSNLVQSESIEFVEESFKEARLAELRLKQKEQITRARDLLLAAQKEIYKVKRSHGWIDLI